MKTTTFAELPMRTRFLFRGMRYEKLGMALARDWERKLVIFSGETEVQHTGPWLTNNKTIATAVTQRAEEG